ncbi:MAG: Holliday junction branch migration protein RuvA [Candidatus Pacebacteria bacterium]|nr:Holliday junction branch migration protein RuvA [Candidatus Paceibacterota bacterium]
MIDRLSGKLVTCDLTEIVVDVNNVGYALTVPMSTFDKLPRVGADVVLHTYLHVREDLLQLYGFADLRERRLFRLLISVSGVGPRLALNVLSSMSVESFCGAVLNGDVKALTRVNGLGKRSGERLVVELREKISEIEPEIALGGSRENTTVTPEMQDAAAALETLGFKSDVARKTVQNLAANLPREEHSAETFIRQALRTLNS